MPRQHVQVEVEHFLACGTTVGRPHVESLRPHGLHNGRRQGGTDLKQPGRQVRTEVRCQDTGIAFEIVISDPDRVVKRVIVETGPGDSPAGTLRDDDVQFTFDHRP